MIDWRRFTPADFEYDFERDKLSEHAGSFEEAVECFFSDFEVRRNKKFRDRYQLLGRTFGGRRLKVIFQIKPRRVVPNHYRMAVMSTKKSGKRRSVHADEAIDSIVASQAGDESAWETPIKVTREKKASVAISGELAARATLLARLHRETRVDNWVERIVRERVELEECAFNDAKRKLAS